MHEILKICMGIVFIVVRKKMGSHCWNIEKGLKMLQMRGGLIWNNPKMRVKWFICLTKVNIINFDYDHNILHEF